MKAIGIVRRVDDLARIVILKKPEEPSKSVQETCHRQR